MPGTDRSGRFQHETSRSLFGGRLRVIPDLRDPCATIRPMTVTTTVGNSRPCHAQSQAAAAV
jgi:hypothetical protein